QDENCRFWAELGDLTARFEKTPVIFPVFSDSEPLQMEIASREIATGRSANERLVENSGVRATTIPNICRRFLSAKAVLRTIAFFLVNSNASTDPTLDRVVSSDHDKPKW